MKKTINPNEMPGNFGLCNVSGCPQAEKCLRQTAFHAHESDFPFITVVSQKWFDKQKAKCKFFLSNEKLRLPRGFMRTINLIPSGQMSRFRALAIGKLGFRRYYQTRKGEVLLTPAEAKYIIALAQKCGLKQDEYFDGYEEAYLWK